MASTVEPRVVIVTRRTEYELLMERHGTHEQARFFLESRDQDIDLVAARHRRFEEALGLVTQAIPGSWRSAAVTRGDLDRFLFEPDDVVVALGQDGLVANVAKYLDAQPVLGVNPDFELFEGALVQHEPGAVHALLPAVHAGEVDLEARSMVEAGLDDGQRLVALNEIFVGHASHQSARYRIAVHGELERHSSSGVIVSTGTGATGWARSIHDSRESMLELPEPTEARLVFFVREAWPSVSTQNELSEGSLTRDQHIELTSEMGRGGILFGDGIEADHIDFGWGKRLSIALSPRRLSLVAA